MSGEVAASNVIPLPQSGVEAAFVKNFSVYDYVIAPSGTCVHQVRVKTTAIVQSRSIDPAESEAHRVLKTAIPGQKICRVTIVIRRYLETLRPKGAMLFGPNTPRTRRFA